VQTFQQLQQFKDFTIQVVNAGETFDILHPKNRIGTFVASDKSKGPTYFDFVLYVVVNDKVERVITYEQRTGHGFKHSGDIGGLLHTIAFNKQVPDAIPVAVNNQVPDGAHFVLSVVGYVIFSHFSFKH
jgi:hypothetical protein